MTVFYVSLLLVSLVVAALVLWFYRFIVQASRETYKTFLPSSTDNAGMNATEGVSRAGRAAKGRGTPWGWKKTNNTKGRVSVGVPVHARSSAGQQVGWPYRQEPFQFEAGSDTGAGRAPHTVSSKPRRIVKGGVNKPWGW